MLQIELFDDGLAQLIKEKPDQMFAAARAAMQSSANELNKAYAAYARSTNFGPFAPLTIAMRKGFGQANKRGYFSRTGYGKWMGAYSRYSISANLSAMVGIISAEDVGSQYLRDLPPDAGDITKNKWRVISKGFARSAKRHAGGYDITIDKKKRRAIAKYLMATYGKDAEWIHKLIPRLGTHKVKARPIAEPVFDQAKGWAVLAFKTMFSTKMQGARYSKGLASAIRKAYSE